MKLTSRASMRFTISLLALFLLTALVYSCKKNLNSEPIVPDQQPDLVTTISSSVSGFVTNENNAAVVGATVKAGATVTTTDQDGYFEFRNVQVVREAATVTVEYAGYFKLVKTYIATTGKGAFFRIKLLPKNIAGSFNGGNGGNITLTNGAGISFPANAIKDESNGALYTGTVNVAVQHLDPTAQDLGDIMPGDLRGINTDGNIKMLTTYGMLAVELTGSAGQLLQIADGKKATITAPIPQSMINNSPAIIPLWYFNETNGLWIEEGAASRNGNNYVGEVSHFSFWNCDAPANYVEFSCTIVDESGAPIPFAVVSLRDLTSNYGVRASYTDSSGHVGGIVPYNTSLMMEVFAYNSCSPSFSRMITIGSTGVYLGNVTVNPTNLTATVSGVIIDCAGNAVTGGYLSLTSPQGNMHYNVNDSGAFHFTVLLCSSSTPVNIVAVNSVGFQQSLPQMTDLVSGNTFLGNVAACGVQILSGFSDGYIYHPSAPRPITNFPKIFEEISPGVLKIDMGDLGSAGYAAILNIDPLTNRITISAAPGAAGAPYTQFDSGLPSQNPGYTPQWPGSAQCSNLYDPVAREYRLRYGYLGGTGWRVTEEIIRVP